MVKKNRSDVAIVLFVLILIFALLFGFKDEGITGEAVKNKGTLFIEPSNDLAIGVEIDINTKSYGKLGKDGKKITLAGGDYIVWAYKKNDQFASQFLKEDVKVKNGKTTPLKVALKKIVPINFVYDSSKISLDSDVYIDGKKARDTLYGFSLDLRSKAYKMEIKDSNGKIIRSRTIGLEERRRTALNLLTDDSNLGFVYFDTSPEKNLQVFIVQDGKEIYIGKTPLKFQTKDGYYHLKMSEPSSGGKVGKSFEKSNFRVRAEKTYLLKVDSVKFMEIKPNILPSSVNCKLTLKSLKGLVDDDYKISLLDFNENEKEVILEEHDHWSSNVPDTTFIASPGDKLRFEFWDWQKCAQQIPEILVTLGNMEKAKIDPFRKVADLKGCENYNPRPTPGFIPSYRLTPYGYPVMERVVNLGLSIEDKDNPACQFGDMDFDGVIPADGDCDDNQKDDLQHCKNIVCCQRGNGEFKWGVLTGTPGNTGSCNREQDWSALVPVDGDVNCKDKGKKSEFACSSETYADCSFCIYPGAPKRCGVKQCSNGVVWNGANGQACGAEEQCVIYSRDSLTDSCMFYPGGTPNFKHIDGMKKVSSDARCEATIMNSAGNTVLKSNCLPSNENTIVNSRYGELDFEKFIAFAENSNEVNSCRVEATYPSLQYDWREMCVKKDKCADGFDNDGEEDVISSFKVEENSEEFSGYKSIFGQLWVPLADMDDEDCKNELNLVTNEEYCVDKDKDGFCENSKLFPDCDDDLSDDDEQYMFDKDFGGIRATRLDSGNRQPIDATMVHPFSPLVVDDQYCTYGFDFNCNKDGKQGWDFNVFNGGESVFDKDINTGKELSLEGESAGVDGLCYLPSEFDLEMEAAGDVAKDWFVSYVLPATIMTVAPYLAPEIVAVKVAVVISKFAKSIKWFMYLAGSYEAAQATYDVYKGDYYEALKNSGESMLFFIGGSFIKVQNKMDLKVEVMETKEAIKKYPELREVGGVASPVNNFRPLPVGVGAIQLQALNGLRSVASQSNVETGLIQVGNRWIKWDETRRRLFLGRHSAGSKQATPPQPTVVQIGKTRFWAEDIEKMHAEVISKVAEGKTGMILTKKYLDVDGNKPWQLKFMVKSVTKEDTPQGLKKVTEIVLDHGDFIIP